jgi:hypothetical protein
MFLLIPTHHNPKFGIIALLHRPHRHILRNRTIFIVIQLLIPFHRMSIGQIKEDNRHTIISGRSFGQYSPPITTADSDVSESRGQLLKICGHPTIQPYRQVMDTRTILILRSID